MGATIIVEATNKSKYDVEWLQLDISLDGTQLSLYADSNSDQNIKAGETREISIMCGIVIPVIMLVIIHVINVLFISLLISFLCDNRV